jgi:tryptophan synthase alpha subunit
MYICSTNKKKNLKNKTMTIQETLELIQKLKQENKESNKELITFYQNKINSIVNEAFSKAFKN